MTGLPDYAVNFRRLFAWHLLSNADVARLLGATPASVSNWVTGNREPSAKYLKLIGDTFAVNVSKAFGDPGKFGFEIADPGRAEEAENNIAAARRAQIKSV